METARDIQDRNGAVGETHQEIVDRIIRILGIDMDNPATLAGELPFSPADTTCGMENEFQAAVMGDSSQVDLPITISQSACFRNSLKQQAGEECPSCQQRTLEQYLHGNRSGVWENSWVRFDRACLNLHAYQVLDADFHKDKSNPFSGYRSDRHRFLFHENGQDRIRVPVSYLMKLALADAAGTSGTHPLVRRLAKPMMESYVSDNSSPEVISFYPSSMKRSGGRVLKPVKETAVRFLLSQLLIAYANTKFGLKESGQTAVVYFSSHTPHRLKQFNHGVPDAFYRELFMSPCLSGWDRGEDKLAYMHLCHRVLSRSRMNAISKLRDAGIITSNLIVLPNISDASLANNGTHVSLGSTKLTRLLSDPSSGYTAADEKYLGDLVIKIAEHFIPLFVGTYSATPYRLDFQDFHPEKVLGFLPHELDSRHLKTLWKFWKKKAGLKILNQPLTPFGPEKIDRLISRLFFLRGDTVTDFRLLDYFASLPSTEENSALDGKPDNEQRLANDLQEMGMFDTRMPMYLLMRMRKASTHGFSGFEGRYYSTFDTLLGDLDESIQIQRIILSLAFKLVFRFKVTHSDIPDTPLAESQRRQFIFAAAMGLDHMALERDPSNRLMEGILDRMPSARKSKSVLRFSVKDYQMALVRYLEDEGADILRESGMHPVLRGLRQRISDPERNGAAGKLTRAVLEKTCRKSPFHLSAEAFNMSMEEYCRNDLRKKHMAEGVLVIEEAFHRLDLWSAFRDPDCDTAVRSILGEEKAEAFLERNRNAILTETAGAPVLEKLIKLIILTGLREIPHG